MAGNCSNCGVLIGKLESPEVFQGHVVCPPCHQRLSASAPPTRVDRSSGRAPLEEKVVYESHKKMFRSHPLQFIVYVVLIPLYGAGLILLLAWWLSCRNTKLTVTNRRTTLAVGLLSKTTSEVLHRDVRNVQVSQGVIQRLMGTGTIGISSSGQAGIEIEAAGIRHPQRVRQLIDMHRGD